MLRNESYAHSLTHSHFRAPKNLPSRLSSPSLSLIDWRSSKLATIPVIPVSELMMNATTSLPDGSGQDSSSTTAGNTVSWQTVFWTLVPLAISAMSQPGGRICGLPSRYRTYLRCSPLLCAADAASIIVRLLVSIAYQRQTCLEAVGTLLHERFREDDQVEDLRSPSLSREELALEPDDGQDESVRSLEKMTWIRWLWFLLGTLPPAIKLMAMSGVPWVQAWGMMFLSSWVLNEGLILFAAVNQAFFTILPSGQISWPGFEHVALSPQYQLVRLVMSRLDAFLASGSLISHVVILNGVFRVLWRTGVGWDYPLSATLHATGSAYPTYVRPDSTSITSTLMLMGLGCVAYLRLVMSTFLPNTSVYVLAVFTFFLMIFSICTNMLIAMIDEWQVELSTSKFHVSGSAVYVFLVSTISSTLILGMLKWLGRRFVLLGQNLLLLHRSPHDREFRIDQGACLSFVFFLSTVAACLLWYCYVYDPSDTFNPSWTGVFG